MIVATLKLNEPIALPTQSGRIRYRCEADCRLMTKQKVGDSWKTMQTRNISAEEKFVVVECTPGFRHEIETLKHNALLHKIGDA